MEITGYLRKMGRFLVLICLAVAMSFISSDYSLKVQLVKKESLDSQRDPQNADPSSFSDLELVRVIGIGTVNYGIEAKLHNRTVVAKITGDKFLHYSDTEMKAFRILNAPPTISNIPKLEMAIPSMKNPFDDTSSLKQLGMSSRNAYWLANREKISVQVMPYLRHSQQPKSMDEFPVFFRSLLAGLEFAHSRNVMHCDLHTNNYHYDSDQGLVSLYDWNAAFFFKPNAIRIHYPSEPSHLMPPEAIDNETAVHATVSAFDIYSVGLLTRKLVKKCCDESEMSSLMTQFADLAMTADPYQRPNASELLQHPYLR